MPTPLPPAGGPIDDADSPMEARPQIRANIIDINPGLDIDGCKWVRASEATVTRYAEGCKVTCDAGLSCRFTTSGPKSVIVVNGQIQSPSDCDVVSIKINGLTVPFRKYQSGSPLKWFYQTYDEWLYTGEVLFPLCEYQLIEVFTSCGDVCQFRLHSCGTCYNATLSRYPATTISRSYTWTRAIFGASIDYTLTETLTLPEIIHSVVWESMCLRTFSAPADIDNAYTFELEQTRTSTGPPDLGSPVYERMKIYNAGVRVSNSGGGISPRGHCTRDVVRTYPVGSSFSNINILGQSVCWAFGAPTGVSFSTCSSTTAGPGKLWLARGVGSPPDICGGTSSILWDVYPSSDFVSSTCAPYLDLGRVFGYRDGPTSWTCEQYTSEVTITSV